MGRGGARTGREARGTIAFAPDTVARKMGGDGNPEDLPRTGRQQHTKGLQ